MLCSSWHPPSLDSAKQKQCVISQYKFPLLQSPLAAFFTPHHLMLGIKLRDMRLACSICTNINARESLELFGNQQNIGKIHANIYCIVWIQVNWDAWRCMKWRNVLLFFNLNDNMGHGICVFYVLSVRMSQQTWPYRPCQILFPRCTSPQEKGGWAEPEHVIAP